VISHMDASIVHVRIADPFVLFWYEDGTFSVYRGDAAGRTLSKLALPEGITVRHGTNVQCFQCRV
jgi:hypothetical protein